MQCNVTFSALPPSPGPLPCTRGDAHHFGGLNGHFHTTFPKLVPSELCSPRWKQRKDSSSSNNSWISTYLLTTKPSCGLQRVALSSIWDLIGLSSTSCYPPQQHRCGSRAARRVEPSPMSPNSGTKLRCSPAAVTGHFAGELCRH